MKNSQSLKKNADFQNFVTACAKTVAVANPANVDALLDATLCGENVTLLYRVCAPKKRRVMLES